MAQMPVTIVGNLTKDPILTVNRDNPSANKCVVRIASSRSIKDGETWRDVDNLFITGEMWGSLANNAKTSLASGMPIIATGFLVTSEWVAHDPNDNKEVKHSRTFLKVHRIGIDLNKHVVSAKKVGQEVHTVPGLDAPEVKDPSEQADGFFGENQNQPAAVGAA